MSNQLRTTFLKTTSMPQNNLTVFNEKRGAWIKCLCGDDRNSIVNQTIRMLWNNASFLIINEARKMAPSAPEGGVQLNGLMHRLLDSTFFESQLLAIRRIIDPHPISGAKSVFSLKALIGDMKAHIDLMTRENIFAAREMEYDYEAVKQKCQEYCMSRLGSGAFAIPSELWWERLEQLHKTIDQLSGTPNNERRPTDTIDHRVFDSLTEKLEGVTTADMAEHVNKFIAHAATPESRNLVNADDAKITLGHIWEAHKSICAIVRFLDQYLLTGNYHVLMPLGGNKFAYIEKPLVVTENVTRLDEVWENYEKEVQNYSPINLATILQAKGVENSKTIC